MPRVAEYDTEQALDRALHYFWQHGYLDTSIQELVEATGVQRYGLYQTFGSKHGLFLAALQRYRQHYVGGRLEGLEKPEAGLGAVEAFLRDLAAAAVTPAGRHGCLMCNTAVELGSRDAESDAEVGRYVDRLRRAFHGALETARRRGELAANADSASLADYLAGVVIGACVVARTPAAPEAVQSLLGTAFAQLPKAQ